jgi:hypothetical protein
MQHYVIEWLKTPDWDAKQWSAEPDPEIDEIINRFNNRHSLVNTEDENEEVPVIGNENTRYFGHFQADYEDFDWDNNYTEVGFPDGQFLGNGLDAQGSAFLSECWREHNTDGAYDYIQMIADDDLRETISRVYDLCDGSAVDRSQFEFAWEQEPPLTQEGNGEMIVFPNEEEIISEYSFEFGSDE